MATSDGRTRTRSLTAGLSPTEQAALDSGTLVASTDCHEPSPDAHPWVHRTQDHRDRVRCRKHRKPLPRDDGRGSLAAVTQAWESGIRYFDTAPHYGLGLSERRLGEALAGYPRDEYVVSTKVGRLLEPNPEPTAFDDDGFVVPGDIRRVWDFSRDGVRRSLDDSLRRLGMDHVDIVYAHDPDQFNEGAARQGARGAG